MVKVLYRRKRKRKRMKDVPNALRTWFKIHFLVDMIFAMPLFLAPVWVLSQFGLTTIDAVTPRLVASAMFAIGGTSLYAHKKGAEVFDTLLTLKIIWSSLAIIALLIALYEGAPKSIWGPTLTFVFFCCLWVYYKRKINYFTS